MWLIRRSRLVIICRSVLAALGFGCGPVESLSFSVIIRGDHKREFSCRLKDDRKVTQSTCQSIIREWTEFKEKTTIGFPICSNIDSVWRYVYLTTSFCLGLGWDTRKHYAVRCYYEEMSIIKWFFHSRFPVERLKSKRVTEKSPSRVEESTGLLSRSSLMF